MELSCAVQILTWCSLCAQSDRVPPGQSLTLQDAILPILTGL